MNNTQLRIEHYLLQLDRELQALTVSQRAEIITEIKSHIVSVQEKDPQREVDVILRDLGEPRTVAESYLSSKGLPLAPPPKTTGPGFKWLAWGLVGFFACLLLVTIVGIYYLSPLLKVDEKNGQVTMFGGLIDVNEKMGRVKVGELEFNEDFKSSHLQQGELDLKGNSVKLIKVPFNTAKIEVEADAGSVLKWSCQSHGSTGDFTHEIKGGVLTLDLNALNIARCSLTLPAGIASEFQGINGHMEIKSPRDAIKVALTNGKIDVHPDHSRAYDFEVSVTNGIKDNFPRSSEKGAIKVKIDVANGVVKKE